MLLRVIVKSLKNLPGYIGIGVCSDLAAHYLAGGAANYHNIARTKSGLLAKLRKSPVKRTKALKEEKGDKKPFSDEEIARLREGCVTEREKAIFELLLSSGMRVSELCGLDRDGMDFSGRECEVLGKGNKRRTCFFSAAAKLHLERYLESRDDDNPALFVSTQGKHSRIGKCGIERIVREIGRRAGVTNVHPHRFRRTMATNNLRRGMKLEEIQQLLGHSNMDTTLIYAKVDKEMLKVNARRLS